MSIVVWDGETLAADCMGTCAGLKYKASKIRRLDDGTLLGFVGQQDSGLLLMEWYWSGAKPSQWPKMQTDKEERAYLLVITPEGKVFKYEGAPVGIPVLEAFTAMGSGRDFALGAMAMGANARRAVEVACEFCDSCGLGVEAFDITPLALVRSGD